MTRKKSIIITALLAAGAASSAPNATKPPAIDPEAMAALEKMGAFLRTQDHFTVRTVTETDYVLDTGQKVRLSQTGVLQVDRPDRLRADIDSARKVRQFFYDGKTFTIFAPRVGFYATVTAPPKIIDLANMLEDRYGLELPLVDLFRWGTDESGKEAITGATYIGQATIGSVVTDQYAFRQPGVDWQIWIQRGERPLPRKIVLTTTDDPARPERATEITWALDAKHDPDVFAFAPPKDSVKVPLSE